MRRVLEEAEEVKQPSWVDRMVEGGVKVSRDRSCRTERLMCIRKRLGLGSPTIGYLHFLSNTHLRQHTTPPSSFAKTFIVQSILLSSENFCFGFQLFSLKSVT